MSWGMDAGRQPLGFLYPASRPSAAAPWTASTPWMREVLHLPSVDRPPVPLVTTLYLPPGDGPFPLWVFNHGKSFGGNTRAQPRFEPIAFARMLVWHGYAVAALNRKGFADSGGVHCSHWLNPLAGACCCARDIWAAVQGLLAHPKIDAGRIIIAGHSYGALGTLAYGSEFRHPGVCALVNFMGGLRAEREDGWQEPLLRTFRHLGRRTRCPSLWFYGRNDSFWPIELARDLHAAYAERGAPARFVDVGHFRDDAHGLMLDEAGVVRWWPEVARLLVASGMCGD
jgi:pimeloyl-ACP methyl ester carboxylesterase